MVSELLRLLPENLTLMLDFQAMLAAWVAEGLPTVVQRASGQTLEVWVAVAGADWGVAC